MINREIRQVNRLQDSIGYINLSEINNIEQYKDKIQTLHDTKAIVLDLRRRPQWGRVYEFVSPFVQDSIYMGYEEIPIIIKRELNGNLLKKSEYLFHENSDVFYNNPLVILINEYTQSGTESVADVFRMAGRAIFIGSQTAGTTGAITYIFLPGLGYVSFTGCRVIDNKDELFYKRGIIPNIKKYRTIKGVREGKDEILEEAIEYVLNKKL